MVAGNAEADLLERLKASIWSQQDDTGGFHGVVWRKDDASMVNTTLKLAVLRTSQCEVPLKQVILQWLGMIQLCGLI